MARAIYKITNTINSKFYVGSSVNTRDRFKRHKRLLKRGHHHSQGWRPGPPADEWYALRPRPARNRTRHNPWHGAAATETRNAWKPFRLHPADAQWQFPARLRRHRHPCDSRTHLLRCNPNRCGSTARLNTNLTLLLSNFTPKV